MNKITAELKKISVSDLRFDWRAIPALIVFFLFIILGIGTYFYWQSIRKVEEKEPLSVVTTIFPIYDIAKNVIGSEEMELIQVVPVGESPFEYSVSSEYQEKIKNADIVFKIGAPLDNWVDEYTNSDTQTVVDLSADMDLLKHTVQTLGASNEQICVGNDGKWLVEYSECEDLSQEVCEQSGGSYESCASSCRHDAEAGSCIQVCVEVCNFSQENITSTEVANPYFWLSVDNSKIIGSRIYTEIVAKRIEFQQNLYANLSAYLQSLDETKNYVSTEISSSEVEELVMFDLSFEYFAQESGITIKNVKFDSNLQKVLDVEEAIDVLDDYVKTKETKVIFKNVISEESEISRYAKNNDLELRTLDPFGGSEGRGSYIDLLRWNVSEIVK